MRLSKRKRRHNQNDPALRGKVHDLGTAVAFLLLKRLLKHEVGFDVDDHSIGFISMRACCNDPASSDNHGNERSCFTPRSPGLATSTSHVQTRRSNASGPMSDGSIWALWK